MKQQAYQHHSERIFDVCDSVFLRLNPCKQMSLKQDIYEKEMLATLHALKKWRPYLMGRHFKVKMDHDSLKYFLEKNYFKNNINKLSQICWVMTLK